MPARSASGRSTSSGYDSPTAVGFVSVRSSQDVPASRSAATARATALGVSMPGKRDENIPHFEATRNELFAFPWVARDESIALILDPVASREEFLFAHAGRWLSAEQQTRALTYLELQRMLLLMYTSCGWFFNDISGIETIQILKYAARAIDLMAQISLPSVRDNFLGILGEAKSNRREVGTGADVFRRLAEPANPRHQGTEPLAMASR